MAKITIFIDHDIMVRHFVLSRVFRPLEAEQEVVYVFPKEHRRVEIDLSTLPIGRYRTVPVSNERAYLYRRLYHATVLKRLRRTKDRQAAFNRWRSMLGRRAFWKSWACSWPLSYDWYHRHMLSKIGENAVLNALLDEEKPDVIIHPTVLEGLFVSDLMRWGQSNGVPTIFLMNSWDNPALKATIVGVPDWFVAWGEHSRKLAHERVGVPLERILTFGAAQFDVYRLPPREAPGMYRKRLGIPADHRLLLYGGSSKGLNETQHLLMLEQGIERGELPNCSVLYRPHPWRDIAKGEQDFFSLHWKHVIMAPDMAEYYRGRFRGENFVYMADYEATHVTLSAVDAVISPLSTILLEAALHGKPILAYTPDEGTTQSMVLASMVKMVHFREFFEGVDCLQCNHADDLVKDCRRLLDLAADRGIGDRLKSQCEYFVTSSDRSYADQLRNLVRELAPASSPAVSEGA